VTHNLTIQDYAPNGLGYLRTCRVTQIVQDIRSSRINMYAVARMRQSGRNETEDVAGERQRERIIEGRR
jgi:hypothetical protein